MTLRHSIYQHYNDCSFKYYFICSKQVTLLHKMLKFHLDVQT